MSSHRILAVFAIAALASTCTHANAQQPPQATRQGQLEQHIKDLEEQLKATKLRAEEAEKKADAAALQNEYVRSVQSQAQSYYDKAFNSLITIISIAVLAGGYLSFRILDRTIQTALARASAHLRSEFTKQLADEKANLQASNEARIRDLEADLRSSITEQRKELKATSDMAYQFSQGLAFGVANHYERAIRCYRRCLKSFAENPTAAPTQDTPRAAAANLFRNLKALHSKNFQEEAKKELKNPIYVKLKNELTYAATQIPEFAPLLHDA